MGSSLGVTTFRGTNKSQQQWCHLMSDMAINAIVDMRTRQRVGQCLRSHVMSVESGRSIEAMAVVSPCN